MSVITITGANDFMRSSELRMLIDAFVAEHGDLALERLDGEETTFERIQEALTSLPFLANKKMVVLNRPSANTGFAEAAESLLAELPETTELLLVEPKFDKRSNLYKLLKKQTDFRDYTQLETAQLASWLVERAQASGAKLTTSDARYLVERVGADQQLLANEVDKLVLYQPTITKQTIDELTEKTPQSTIFELIETAFSGKRERALELYEEQRRLKVEPIQIIAMLAWQLHVLALVCAAEGRATDSIAGEAKLNSFTVSKTQRLAAQLSLGQVRRLVDQLVVIDQRSKREAIDLDEALRNYIVQLHTN
jgi:DNA polymerase-3 subunit delta